MRSRFTFRACARNSSRLVSIFAPFEDSATCGKVAMSERKRPPSIRHRLLLFLISSLLLMLSGAALVTYLVATNSANNAYDRSLLDPVLDIADNVTVDSAGAHLALPKKALEALVFDKVDTVIFQIR